MWGHVVLFLAIVVLTGFRIGNHLEPDNAERNLKDLKVANLVRDAVHKYQSGEQAKTAPLDFSNLPRLLDQLDAAKVGDAGALAYVRSRPSRFAIRGKSFDARWVFDDSAL